MTYFLISTDEDGGHYIEALTRKQLQDHLDELVEDEDPVQFEKELPKDRNMAYWLPVELIIKGEIIVPKAVEVTTVYEF